ncbi:SUN domain-containing protein 1 isoform X2 [Electrophorus electricus]|uniref:SUN domain-containing protein 1 isoform X2 n=1 Tax=Electrophorus electricus TaxID=8005 RepID=UPI0015D0B10E|nr:SUN domain-containing protein 1 isoform X2 [Electrophorus electricus]
MPTAVATLRYHADIGTDLLLKSSSYSSTALDYEREHHLAPAIDSPSMTRRSLRLHAAGTGPYADDGLLDSSFNRSATYSTGGSVHYESMTSLRSRRALHSASGSGFPLQMPAKGSQPCPALDSSLHGCTASDASLLSTLLDESSIQEHTLVDSFWGLDEDGDLKDQTMLADHSLPLTSSHTAQTQTSAMHAGYICSDCMGHCVERRDILPAGRSYSKPCSSAYCSYSATASHPQTTVYSREKSRRHKPGVLRLLSGAFLYNNRRVVATVTHAFILLIQSAVLKTQRQGKALLCSVKDGGVWVCRRLAGSVAAAVALLTHPTGLRGPDRGSTSGVHSRYCGTMNLNECVTQRNNPNLSGPLCDDCKVKQNPKTCPVHTWSSRAQHLVGILCFLISFTGSGLVRAGQGLLSAGWFVVQKIPSIVCLPAVFPGRAASGAFWWLGAAWYQLVLLMTLLNTLFLTRCVPTLRLFLLILLPLLLLLAFCWCPSSLWDFLPVADVTTGHHLISPSDPAPVSEDLPCFGPSHTHSPDLERLERMERSLAQLWERVAADSVQQERHAKVLGLCRSLRDKLRARMDRESLERWVSGLLEQRVTLLKDELAREMLQPSLQRQEEVETEGQAQESRLVKVEVLLQKLALRTEELQRRGEAETSFIRGADVASHAVLLAEVRRLEEALGTVRADLQGVMACQGRCQQLDSLHDAVSEKVRQELRTLLYGAEGPEPSGPLLQWLSTQYASSHDLLASLAALEERILGNLSLQLEQTQQKPSAETVTQAVLQTAGKTGLSEEHVQLMVQNALKLYSQDRIGLADYALESSGGSILSTRCSETYKTKTALMSLFGLPLWYFSQSPRVVIQPDIYPGNCWAFRGPHGYLVIRLSMKIVPTAFSLEHIPKALSPTGNIHSAPRNFTVYGLEHEEQAEGQLLGNYIYQEGGDTLQTYPVKENKTDSFRFIELRVLSNWGHQEYTCLYRFRVHGEPAPQ